MLPIDHIREGPDLKGGVRSGPTGSSERIEENS